MKIFLMILFVCSTSFSAPKCFNDYLAAAEKVEKSYKRSQIIHDQNYPIERYIYEFFPVSMFPFFCLPKDTVKKLPIYIPVYLCGCSTNFGVCFDGTRTEHVQIAILQYVRIGKNLPWSKTFTIYFLKLNKSTKDWDEERSPLSVVLAARSDGTYYCLSPK